MSQPPPSPSEPPGAPEPAKTRRPWVPLAAAVLVLLGFVAYAMLGQATYKANAQIILKPKDNQPLSLPSSTSPAQQIRGAAIDDETLDRTAAALKLGEGPPGRSSARQHLETHLVVTTSSPGTFDIAVHESTAQSAERVANLIAAHAAARAARMFAPPLPAKAEAREAARSRNAAALGAFLAAHPELSPSTPSVVPVTRGEPRAIETADLRAERDQIQAKIARLTEASGSDNPFGDPATSGPQVTQLRRRLAEIDQTLIARKRAEQAERKDARPKVTPEVDREWKRLLEGVANPTPSVEPEAASSLLVMLRPATTPTKPVKPDRPLLVRIGALAALATFMVGVLVQLLISRTSVGHEVASPSIPETERIHASSHPPQRPPSDPPYQSSHPPHQSSHPPQRPPSDAPQQASNYRQATAPRPIVAVGAAPQVSVAETRQSSSKPPAGPVEGQQLPSPVPEAALRRRCGC